MYEFEFQEGIRKCIDKLSDAIDSAESSGIPMDRDHEEGEGYKHQRTVEYLSRELMFTAGLQYTQMLFDDALRELKRSVDLFGDSINGRNQRERLVAVLGAGLNQPDIGIPEEYREYIPDALFW